jgi:DNA-directed RNA polymerase specialized sigma24 family protein
MTHQELNRLYEERMNHLSPYIRTIPDDDMAQEAKIGIFQALKKDPGANDTYLKQGARWQMINSSRRGKSVDNGWKRGQVKILHYDTAEADRVFSFIFKNRMNIPLDELVNDKIGMDNFFSRLTRREKDFVARKLEGWSNKQIMEGLRISYSRLKEMMEDIRFKIELTFA